MRLFNVRVVFDKYKASCFYCTYRYALLLDELHEGRPHGISPLDQVVAMAASSASSLPLESEADCCIYCPLTPSSPTDGAFASWDPKRTPSSSTKLAHTHEPPTTAAAGQQKKHTHGQQKNHTHAQHKLKRYRPHPPTTPQHPQSTRTFVRLLNTSPPHESASTPPLLLHQVQVQVDELPRGAGAFIFYDVHKK